MLTPVEDPLLLPTPHPPPAAPLDAAAPLRQSCSFAMHAAQQDSAIDGRTPPGWAEHAYSTELWLARRWATYPQAAANQSHAAAFVFVAFNQSLLCELRKLFTLRKAWATQVVPYADALGGATPVVLATLTLHCPPWVGSRTPRNVRLLQEVARDALATPFAVAAPAWLVRGDAPPGSYRIPAWEQRKLLFFGGRAPKPKISAVRAAPAPVAPPLPARPPAPRTHGLTRL